MNQLTNYIGYDTSFIMAVIGGEINDSHIILSRGQNIVCENVMFENFEKINVNPTKFTRIEFCLKHNMIIISPFDKILLQEFKGQAITFLENQYAEIYFELLKNPNSPSYNHYIKKYNETVQKNIELDEEAFIKIKKATEKRKPISHRDIMLILDNVLSGNEIITVLMPIEVKGEYKFSFEIAGNKIRAIYNDGIDIPKINEKEFNNLKEEYPNFYNYAVWYIFCSSIFKPVTFNAVKNENFHINLNNLDSSIEIKKTFLSDLRIAVSTLPFVDEFYTCDKGQAILIEYLWPHYKNKIKYTPRKSK